MDNVIWSQLPSELLLPIMRYAIQAYNDTDERDILWKKWLTVVRGNSFLYHALLSQHWKDVNLTWPALRLDPDEDRLELEEHAANVSEERLDSLFELLEGKETIGMVYEMLHMDHGICPGHYVTRLFLKLEQSLEDLEEYAPLSHRMIQYTLNLIFPTLKRVKHITVNGPTSNTIFGAISQLDKAQLQKLHVGGKWCNYQYISGPENNSFNVYDWSKLNGLTGLTELVTLQFVEEEAASLSRMIRSLPNLRYLGLAPRRSNTDHDDPLIKGRPSPTRILFGGESAVDEGPGASGLANLLAKLPSTLQALQLHETFYIGPNRLRIPEPPNNQDYEPSECVLEDFLTECDDLESTNNALKWLPNAKLERITYSPVLATNQSEQDDDLGIPLDNLNAIVSAHQKSLKEIMLSNAWKLHPNLVDHFAMSWSNHFQICEAVLFTDCIRSNECKLKHEHGQIQDLKHFLFGCSENTNQWGSEIRRIRLEVPRSVHDIDLKAKDLMAYPSLQKLRILIVGPRSDCDLDEKEHMNIARALLEQSPDTLRVIRLCHFTFWVHHCDEAVEKARPVKSNIDAEQQQQQQRRLIPWDEAIANSIKSRSSPQWKQGVEAWLTKHDGQFLDDDSRLHKRRMPFRRRVAQSELDQFWLQSFNFLVVRPTDSCD